MSERPLSIDQLRHISIAGWGGAVAAPGYLVEARSVEEIVAAFDLARRSGKSLSLRGAGRSYGDAAINADGLVLDLSPMNRVLAWDKVSGEITVEPGVTIDGLWRHTLPDGWWPPVVPGTSTPTLGGAVAMNIHGKNNFAVGPIGDHIVAFDLLTPDGSLMHCSPESNTDLFDGVIGGFGMLGVVVSLTLRMKRVYSGLLDVEASHIPDLRRMIDFFVAERERSDYMVGWIDGFASGSALGRGVAHSARYLAEGDDPNPSLTLAECGQRLPSTILGVIPKSQAWWMMRPFINNLGMRAVNLAKERASRLLDRRRRYRQSLAAFSFLLDSVPNWRRAYGEGGLVQFQSFIPVHNAYDAFHSQLFESQSAGLPTYLAVIKRHRPDRFLLSHAVDGYSLALDFRVTGANRERVWGLCDRLAAITCEAGGRFYPAKDATLRPEQMQQALGEERVERFLELKRQHDPEMLLQSNLFRRLFAI